MFFVSFEKKIIAMVIPKAHMKFNSICASRILNKAFEVWLD